MSEDELEFGASETPQRVSTPVDRLFPEWSRRSALSSGALEYSFDECTEESTRDLPRRTRVSFEQLGTLGTILNPRIGSTTCAAKDCYLRVSSANLESQLTIGRGGMVPCEDPDQQNLGTCSLAYDSATPPSDALRGHIVAADRIHVTHEINPGPMSLVLMAKEEISFEPGAGIRSFRTPAASVARVDVVPPSTAPRCRCLAWIGIANPYEPDSRRCTRLQCDTHTSFTRAEVGRPGEDAGSVVLIAPRITFRSSGTASFIRLDGQGGGSGGSYNGPIRCGRGIDAFLEDSSYHDLNQECIDHALNQAPAPGDGGSGGSGGNLVLVTNALDLPAQVHISSRGGAGGVAGARTTVVDSNGRSHGYTGHVASGGSAGTNGYRDDPVLGSDYNDYAFLLVKRGSERILANARYYSRYIHGSSGPGEANRQIAIGEVTALIEQYCSPSSGGPYRLAIRSPRAPMRYLPDSPGSDRRDMCSESESLLLRLESDLNHFGLEENFLMYLRPDIMAEYRTQMVDRVDEVRRLFDATVAVSDEGLNEIQVLQDFTLGEQRKELEIAEKRSSHLAEVVRSTKEQLDHNVAQIEDIGRQIEETQDKVERALRQAPCDFGCYFGQIVSLASNIAGLVSNVASALDNISSFVSSLGALLTPPTLPGGTGTEEVRTRGRLLARYAKTIFEGTEVGGKAVPGLAKIGEGVGKIIESWKQVDAVVIGPPTVAQQWNRVTYATEHLQRDLRQGMSAVQAGIANVELSLAAGSVVDRNGALANLRFMLQLHEQRLLHVSRMGDLNHAHLMAAGELILADLERDLAETKVRNLESRVRIMNCRLGTVACSDIPRDNDSVAARRDAFCVAGSALSDLALLFDFFYRRANDFVTLVPCTGCPSGGDVSHDFRRNLLRGGDRVAFVSPSQDPLFQDFLSRLTPSDPRDRIIEERICRPGEDCGGGPMPTSRTYQLQVMNQLLRDGRASFDMAAECRPGEPWSYCSAALFGPLETARQRVTAFDTVLRMRPGYRLGCFGVNCAGSDEPLNGMRFSVAYRHDDRATFRWDDNSLRSFLFPEDYPRRACELMRGFSGGSTDCRRVMDFNGVSIYGAPSRRPTFAPPPWTPGGYSGRETLFGTSVRGAWHIDIGETLAQLNGPAGDGCFSNLGARPFPETCLPAECLSPCFDDMGTRLPSSSSGVPAYCGCYDSNGQMLPGASGRVECHDRAPSLTFVRNDVGLPGYCSGSSGSRPQVDMCLPFVANDGGFYPNGDILCCNQDGRLKGGLPPATLASCESRGFVSDEACSAPEICRAVCGPRCKEFKRALLGLEYVISYRTDGTVGEGALDPGRSGEGEESSGDPDGERPCASEGRDTGCMCEGGRVAGRSPDCEYCFNGQCM